MAIYVISDIHGALFWKDAIKSIGQKDHAVFLGDYFDRRGEGPFAESQCENFYEICEFARNRPSTTHLLIGNHDFQYLPWDSCGTSSFDRRHSQGYRKALLGNMDILEVLWVGHYRSRPVLFSHAGISQAWLDLCGIGNIGLVNGRFAEDPGILDVWAKGGPFADLSGNDVWQSPAWIRPESLAQSPIEGFDQVIGHTVVERPVAVSDISGGTIWRTCTLNGDILVLD